MSEYPRKYLQAYGFLSAFGQKVDSRPPKIHLNLTKGFVFGTLFKLMQTSAAPANRAQLKEVAYASPGYLRFDVEPSIAAAVRDSIAGYMRSVSVVREVTKTLVSWSNDRKDTKEITNAQAGALVRKLGNALVFDGEALLRSCDTAKYAAKAAVSYSRRVQYLAQDEASGSALLVGLDEPDEASREAVLGQRRQRSGDEDQMDLDGFDSDDV